MRSFERCCMCADLTLLARSLVARRLWQGDRQKRHPTLKLKLVKSPEEDNKNELPAPSKRKIVSKRKMDSSDSDSEPEPDILQKGASPHPVLSRACVRAQSCRALRWLWC
jgi:hypothetical protein